MRLIYYLLYYAIAFNLPYNARWEFVGKFSAYLRRIICRKLFAKTGENFSIGKGVDFGYLGHHIFLGEHANLGNFLKIKGNGDVNIGKHVMMGEDVTIITQDHKYLNEGYDGFITGTVVIGDYAWIGDRVILLRKTTIGKHVIIGAGSVVTGEIPDYAIAVGNPARVVKFRNEAS